MSDAIEQAVESIRDLIDIVDRPDREIFLKALNAIDELQALQSGEPVGWQFYEGGKWYYGTDMPKDHRLHTEAAGIPVRDLYTTGCGVVDVNQQLVEALLLFVQNNSVRALVPSTCEIAEEALLSAGKGGE
jgi:hypothetical protein